jgi:hypothetical protein
MQIHRVVIGPSMSAAHAAFQVQSAYLSRYRCDGCHIWTVRRDQSRSAECGPPLIGGHKLTSRTAIWKKPTRVSCCRLDVGFTPLTLIGPASASGRHLPNKQLGTGHWRHVIMAGHATVTVDPLLPVASGSFRARYNAVRMQLTTRRWS